MISGIKTATQRCSISNLDHISEISSYLTAFVPACSCVLLIRWCKTERQSQRGEKACFRLAELAAAGHHINAVGAFCSPSRATLDGDSRGTLLREFASPTLTQTVPLPLPHVPRSLLARRAPTATPPPSESPGSVCTGGSQQRRLLFS